MIIRNLVLKLFTVFLFGFLLMPNLVVADGNLDSALGNLKDAGKEAHVDDKQDIEKVVGGMINAALTLVGMIFLVLMVYAGYLWMTARGEESQVEQSKKIITAAIIGMILVVSAYSITYFVTSRFGG